MGEAALEEAVSRKSQDQEKIWSGSSFNEYLGKMRFLQADLPVSAETGPVGHYRFRYAGDIDYVFGEIMHDLLSFEGYLRDKAYKIQECYIRPITGPNKTLAQFNIRYQTREGEERTRSCEAIRTGQGRFLFFTDTVYRT
jgi:hypothetical protein